MAKSGNHTSNIQAVYIMWNIPFIHKIKIGISGGVKYRRKMISESTPGFVFPVWVIVIPFAYDVEQWLHRIFRFAHSPFGKGSGKSEWFSSIIFPLVWLIMTCLQLIWWAFLFFIALFLYWILAGAPKL